MSVPPRRRTSVADPSVPPSDLVRLSESFERTVESFGKVADAMQRTRESFTRFEEAYIIRPIPVRYPVPFKHNARRYGHG